MDVTVDQAGQYERVAQIHHPTFSDKAVADFGDKVPDDHESFIAKHNTALGVRQKPSCLNERRFACQG